MDVPDTTDDVDLVLRHVSRRFPGELARALLPRGTTVSSVRWEDTQVAERERRLDRTLDLVAAGQQRWEHVEWQSKMAPDVPYRIFEYHAMLAMAVRAPAGRRRGVLPIRSTLVLLTGRRRPWPAEGEYRTSPPDAPFSGVTFRIDAVYQRTVAELEDRESLLWLVFAPLAVDADAAAMVRVLARMRAGASGRDLVELVATLLVMADKDGRRRGLRKVILPMLKEERIMESWVYRQGKAEGRAKGKAEGLAKGKAEGKREALLAVLAARGLAPSAAERKRIAALVDADVLDRCIRASATASTVAEVLAVLGVARPSSPRRTARRAASGARARTVAKRPTGAMGSSKKANGHSP